MFAIAFVVLSVILILICNEKRGKRFGILMLSLYAAAIVLARLIINMFATTWIYIVLAVVVAIALWILLTKLFKNKTPDIILLVLWGVFISAYVQVLFLNGRMYSITGAQIEYSTLSLQNIINLLIWTVITLLPLCVFFVFQAKQKKFKYEKILTFSVLILCAMQVAGLASTAASTELPKGYDEDVGRYISFEPTLRLSDDKNIVVFIVDNLDVSIMRETLRIYPHLYEALYGFTHYENNVAEFFDTLPSTVSMLTQHYYREGLGIREYWNEAWAQHNVLDTFRENGFTINLLLDYLSTYNSISNIESRADNLTEFDALEVNLSGLFNVSMHLSLGRLSPYLLKNIFMASLTPAFGNEIFTVPTYDPLAVMPPIVSYDVDAQFLEYIIQNEFTNDSEKPVLSIIHLNGAHGSGWSYDEYNIPGTRLSFEVITYYIRGMKKVGVYDSSTIIILSDHGQGNGDDFGSGVGVPVTASLLIKPRGATGSLVIDSDTELSNKYFAASILELAGLPHRELGLSFFDIIYGRYSPPPYRTVYAFDNWWSAWWDDGGTGQATIPLLGIYEVRGDANERESWTFVPNIN